MSDNDTNVQFNVTSDTQDNIAHARDVSGAYAVRVYGSVIGDLLRARYGRMWNANWLTYYDENGHAGSYSYRQFIEVLRELAGMDAG